MRRGLDAEGRKVPAEASFDIVALVADAIGSFFDLLRFPFEGPETMLVNQNTRRTQCKRFILRAQHFHPARDVQAWIPIHHLERILSCMMFIPSLDVDIRW